MTKSPKSVKKLVLSDLIFRLISSPFKFKSREKLKSQLEIISNNEDDINWLDFAAKAAALTGLFQVGKATSLKIGGLALLL